MTETKQVQHTPGPHAADLIYWLDNAVTSSDRASLYAAAHAVVAQHTDLLAACEMAERFMAAEFTHNHVALIALRAAIAKARGQS